MLGLSYPQSIPPTQTAVIQQSQFGLSFINETVQNQQQHHTTTSIRQCATSIKDITQSQNNVSRTVEECNDGFTTVKRRKKYTKADRIISHTSDSCSSSTTDRSTSSTNTSSISANAQHKNYADSRKKLGLHRAKCVDNDINFEITHEAKRFAETRYAFPPFILKFNQAVTEKIIIDLIFGHFKSNYNLDLNFAGHKLKNNGTLVLFVKDRESFSVLFKESNWPTLIDSMNYERILPKFLPPQFSILIKNVPIDWDINTLLLDLKTDYPDITSAHRLIDKKEKPTTFVRLDINNVLSIDELISKKFIYVNNLRFSTTEYIAPAKVLICTRCFKIGHFKSSCRSKFDYCRNCGEVCYDSNTHKLKCDKITCCIRCKGPHDAMDTKCPDIKLYRSTLTQSLLPHSNRIKTQQQQHPKYVNNPKDYPALIPNKNDYYNNANNAWRYTRVNDNPLDIDQRMNDLYNKVYNIEVNMNRLLDLNNNYLDQLHQVQKVVMNLNQNLQLQQIDTKFQHDFISKCISPICHMVLEIIPLLTKQNVLPDKTSLCPSLSSICINLAKDMPSWTNVFLQNELIKSKLMQDYNMNNQYNNSNNSIHNDQPPLTSN